MLCNIANLLVEIPAAGGMSVRCREYLHYENAIPDIIISEEKYKPEKWPTISYENMCYMESGFQFHGNLLRFEGMMLHSSAVEVDGKAYLFSGPSGMGKSTHTRLWQSIFGEKACVFNDDKPALRRIDGRWYAYGTPWCGKDGINQNKKVPLAGICFLKRGEENKIRRLDPKEALPLLMSQTIHKFKKIENLDLLLNNVNYIIKEIPIFELENRPVEEAARLSYETMLLASKEVFDRENQ
ncbi:MAG: hypothetical protein IKJ82_02790 [Oscillospiraceae bacterium]|nr:hypothetical protein [Oscillospiraceae bacterium]